MVHVKMILVQVVQQNHVHLDIRQIRFQQRHMAQRVIVVVHRQRHIGMDLLVLVQQVRHSMPVLAHVLVLLGKPTRMVCVHLICIQRVQHIVKTEIQRRHLQLVKHVVVSQH